MITVLIDIFCKLLLLLMLLLLLLLLLHKWLMFGLYTVYMYVVILVDNKFDDLAPNRAFINIGGI